jgi:hypothetical protein
MAAVPVVNALGLVLKVFVPSENPLAVLNTYPCSGNAVSVTVVPLTYAPEEQPGELDGEAAMNPPEEGDATNVRERQVGPEAGFGNESTVV